MAYLVLARKYRPQTFEEVIGQEHVTQTLSNAIAGNRVAHAILLAGPRGTGKTTIARILAKAMNCESGPLATPCNTCRSCEDITAGRGVDVFEIDGASNNSVDQVRELRDNIRYMPAHSRYKIYIIDEVHMLSLAAFNALLKTLEEPPAHVLFFFATTEYHKIPITILSRCQRHDLRRIDPERIVRHMESLCAQESVDLALDTLRAIARQSGGSMRDALSLLDQILVCSGSDVDDDYVMNLLGTMDRKILFDLSEAVFTNHLPRSLAVIDEAFKSGHDLKRFYAEVLNHFRHLMLIKVKAGSELLVDLSKGEVEELGRQADKVTVAFIDQVYNVLFNAEPAVRRSLQPRLAIEMVFFKIHQIKPALPIDLLIERMDQLLKDPNLRSSAGIVESQAGYGDVHSRYDGGSLKLEANPHAQEAGSVEADSVQVQGGDRSPHEDGGNDPWGQVLNAVSKAKPSVGAAMSRLTVGSVTDKTIFVKVRELDFSAKMIQKNLSWLETVCLEQTGRQMHVDFSVDTAETKKAEKFRQQSDSLKHQLLNHPLVADAVDIFNGKIDEIKIK
jgi:DNA polymerase-3 subunit gamma/tau